MTLVDDEYEQVGYYEASSGYELIKKRKSETARYPEYQHTKTGGGTPSKMLAFIKEFIFKKSEKNSEEIMQEYQSKKWVSEGSFAYKHYDSNKAPFFNKNVDETESSSGYEDHENESETKSDNSKNNKSS